MKSKAEEVLEIRLSMLLNESKDSYKDLEEMRSLPEYQVIIEAMQEYADSQNKPIIRTVESLKLEWQEHNKSYGMSWNEIASLVNEVQEATLQSKPLPSDEEICFIEIKVEEPELGVEVILYNEDWINEDWNPKGIRVGFKDDVSGWTSAYWCNYHDNYHTRISEEDDHQFEDFKAINQIPTHWKPINPLRDNYQPKQIDIKEELIQFCNWIESDQPIAFQNMHEFVEEYLIGSNKN